MIFLLTLSLWGTSKKIIRLACFSKHDLQILHSHIFKNHVLKLLIVPFNYDNITNQQQIHFLTNISGYWLDDPWVKWYKKLSWKCNFEWLEFLKIQLSSVTNTPSCFSAQNYSTQDSSLHFYPTDFWYYRSASKLLIFKYARNIHI